MKKYEWLRQQLVDLPTDTCLLWPWAKSNSGYGMLSAKGQHTYAHRAAYELVVGPIPPGLEVDHLCRVRLCFNPTHLEPVTRSVNRLRGLRKTRITHCPAGHAYDATNTRIGTDGGRDCRICCRESGRRSRAKRKAAA